jgi:anti-sigma B factor antagonist
MVSWLNGDPTPLPPSSPSFVVDDVPDDDGVTVRVRGELDILTAPELAAHVRHRLDASRPGDTMTVDLAGVGFLAAKGVSVLLEAKRDAEARGCRFAVVGCQPFAVEVLDVLGVRQELGATGT